MIVVSFSVWMVAPILDGLVLNHTVEGCRLHEIFGGLTPNETRIHTDELVDIREVSVDKNLPKEERIAAFIRQIKNPYRFRCGDFVVNACFAGNGVTLEECLQGILR